MTTYEHQLNKFLEEYVECKEILPEGRNVFFHMSVTSMLFGEAIANLYKRQYLAYSDTITASAGALMTYLNSSVSLDTIHEDLLLEYAHASKKHPGMTLDAGGHDDATAAFAIGEEVGEMFAALTYDNEKGTGHGSSFYREAIQYIGLIIQHITYMANQTDSH